MYWTESDTGTIGELVVATEERFSYGTVNTSRFPTGLTSARDVDNVPTIWYAERCGNKISEMKLNLQHTVTRYNPLSNGPTGVVMGPDGYVWYTTVLGDQLVAIDPEDPTKRKGPAGTDLANPFGITSAPNGFLYFTEALGDKIDRIDPTDLDIRKTALMDITGPNDIEAAPGPEVALYFTVGGSNVIARLVPNQFAPILTTWAIPAEKSHPKGLTITPDGMVWFTEGNADMIGRLNPITDEITEFRVCPVPPCPGP